MQATCRAAPQPADAGGLAWPLHGRLVNREKSMFKRIRVVAAGLFWLGRLGAACLFAGQPARRHDLQDLTPIPMQ